MRKCVNSGSSGLAGLTGQTGSYPGSHACGDRLQAGRTIEFRETGGGYER